MTTGLSAFLRPELPHVPEQWRRLLQPVIAALALSVLAVLAGLAAIHIVAFTMTVGLIFVILTRIFGIDLSLA